MKMLREVLRQVFSLNFMMFAQFYHQTFTFERSSEIFLCGKSHRCDEKLSFESLQQIENNEERFVGGSFTNSLKFNLYFNLFSRFSII